MIRVLRRRFVVSAMAAISVLLTVLLGVINIGNLIAGEQRTEQVLDMLSEGEGMYSPPENEPRHFSPDGKKRGLPPGQTAPTPDEMLGARYFFVRFDAAGEIVSLDMKHIHAVDGDGVREMARAARDGGEASGRMERFRFRVTRTRDGRGSFVIFLDVSNQIRSVRTVFIISLAVGAFCWAAMLLLVLLLSQKAIRPIAENIEKQKQFVTNAGHEIKTPLSIILINTDALELHLGSNKWSKNIRAQTERLTELMKNLLTLAKLDESSGKLPESVFSANLLLEELLDPYYEIAEEKGVSLSAGFQSGVSLRANRESITQLFSILLDNAAKYTPSGGKIEASLSENGKHVVFELRNTCDIPEETDLSKLFDRFYRCDSARTQKDGGCGIGLSAAQAIVRAHGGTISVGREGDTILFTVKL